MLVGGVNGELRENGNAGRQNNAEDVPHTQVKKFLRIG